MENVFAALQRLGGEGVTQPSAGEALQEGRERAQREQQQQRQREEGEARAAETRRMAEVERAEQARAAEERQREARLSAAEMTQRAEQERVAAAERERLASLHRSQESGVGRVVSVPNVKYAQRADSLYVTIELPDVTSHTIKADTGSLYLKCTSGGKEYAMDVKLWSKVLPQAMITKVLPRNIQLWLKKAVEEKEYWPRMLQDKAFEKKHFSIDWHRWKDEDDCEAGGFDTSALGGGGGGGGVPGGGRMAWDEQRAVDEEARARALRDERDRAEEARAREGARGRAQDQQREEKVRAEVTKMAASGARFIPSPKFVASVPG